nr:MAG TPA: hypothetical protein [Caudoviricetes sp.]
MCIVNSSPLAAIISLNLYFLDYSENWSNCPYAPLLIL